MIFHKKEQKKIELVAKPAKSQVYVAEDFMVLEVPPNKLKVASKWRMHQHELLKDMCLKLARQQKLPSW